MAPEQKTFQLTDKTYPFVPSTAEHNRLEEQSAGINDLMLNKIICSPLKNPQKILDIGCGTGLQTSLLANLYPDATIIGLDMSPVPDLRPKPENVTYILGEYNELVQKGHELLRPGTFDFIYQRMFVMGVTSWPRHLELIKSLLKPGGYFESQEMDFWTLYDKNDNIISHDWTFLEVSLRVPAARGVDVRVGDLLPGQLNQVAFQGVEQKKFPMAFQTGWKERPETESLARYLNWATRPWWGRFLKDGAREGEDGEAFMRDFESKVLDGDLGVHGHFVVTVGKKDS